MATEAHAIAANAYARQSWPLRGRCARTNVRRSTIPATHKKPAAAAGAALRAIAAIPIVPSPHGELTKAVSAATAKTIAGGACAPARAGNIGTRIAPAIA